MFYIFTGLYIIPYIVECRIHAGRHIVIGTGNDGVLYFSHLL